MKRFKDIDFEEILKVILRWIIILGFTFTIITYWLIPRAHALSESTLQIPFVAALILIPLVVFFIIFGLVLFFSWLFNF